MKWESSSGLQAQRHVMIQFTVLSRIGLAGDKRACDLVQPHVLPPQRALFANPPLEVSRLLSSTTTSVKQYLSQDRIFVDRKLLSLATIQERGRLVLSLPDQKMAAKDSQPPGHWTHVRTGRTAARLFDSSSLLPPIIRKLAPSGVRLQCVRDSAL